MTIAELAALLRELGAVEAVNMDGGGSTTMVVRGKVVNSPSDLTGERPVGDALLVFAPLKLRLTAGKGAGIFPSHVPFAHV